MLRCSFLLGVHGWMYLGTTEYLDHPEPNVSYWACDFPSDLKAELDTKNTVVVFNSAVLCVTFVRL